MSEESGGIQTMSQGDEQTSNATDFGWALNHLRQGKKLMRKGWNGKGIFIELQKPDEHSKMTHPYIFINTESLVSESGDACRNLVPWLASQTDMLAEDWCLVE